MMEIPSSGNFIVLVEDDKHFQWQWNGHADNCTDALAAADDAWQDLLKQERDKG